MAFRPWTVANLDMALAKITVKKLKQAPRFRHESKEA